MYQCSCCQSGAMNTAEQYMTHINGTKHKKKAFQLQAPFAGIEYEEFRPKTKAKTQIFDPVVEDFPSLSSNENLVNGTNTIKYSSIVENFNNVNGLARSTENTNGHVNFDEVEEENDVILRPESIDDVFFKDGSRCAAARHTIDSYSKNNKTASAALNEIAVAMYWKLEFEQVPASNKKYGFMVRIDEFDLIAGEGDNKKEAKQHASSEAIKTIRMKLRKNKSAANQVTVDKSIGQSRPKICDVPADAYCRLTIDKLLEIENLRENNFVVPRRYASFIMTDKDDQSAKEGVVIAFGAGSGVLKRTENLSKLPGYHLTNFDSLVLAKRSLQCFFFNQLTLMFDRKLSKNKTEKVYFMIGRNGKVKLREGCRIHLFMSHAPHGDCVESLPLNWTDPIELTTKEMERDRNGVFEPTMFMTYNNSQYMKQPGHIRVLKENDSGDWTSLVDFRARKNVAPDFMVMSPTDKLTAWIHVGIHGALLSHLMDPVHLYSIQVARNYMHEHFSRALICRVPLENLRDDSAMSTFKDPYIGRVTKLPDTIQPLFGIERRNVSFNWYSNPITDLPEIIDNDTGLVHRDSPFKLPNGESDYLCSRLSKVCMLVRLKHLFKVAVEYYALRPELQRTRNLQGIGEAAGHRYDLFKNSAVDYRSMKQTLFQLLNEKKYGDWAPNNSANNFDLLKFYEV